MITSNPSRVEKYSIDVSIKVDKVSESTYYITKNNASPTHLTAIYQDTQTAILSFVVLIPMTRFSNEDYH